MKAFFKQKTFTVFFYADAGGTLSGETAQTVPSGGSISAVTAIPNDGYAFKAWTTLRGGYASYSYDATLVISEVRTDTTATVSFTATAPSHTVSFFAGEGGVLQGETTQVVVDGGMATAVEALPEEDFVFVKWSGDHKGAENPLTIDDVRHDMEEQAEFARVALSGTIGTRFTLLADVIHGYSVDGTTPFAPFTKVSVLGKHAKTLNKGRYVNMLECEWTANLPIEAGDMVVCVNGRPSKYHFTLKPPEIISVEKDGQNVIVKGSCFGKTPKITIGGKRIAATISFNQNSNVSKAVVRNPRGMTGKLVVTNKIGSASAELND